MYADTIIRDVLQHATFNALHFCLDADFRRVRRSKIICRCCRGAGDSVGADGKNINRAVTCGYSVCCVAVICRACDKISVINANICI